MAFFVHFLESAGVDMGVDLRGADVAVTQHHLHRAQVGPAAEQVGGKGMAQGMRADLFADAGAESRFLDDLPEADAGHGFATAGDKKVRGGTALQQERSAFPEIFLDDTGRLFCKGNDPFLVAFAQNTQMAICKAAGCERQPHQFGDPKTGGIEQVQHGVVAQANGAVRAKTVQKRLHFRHSERFGELETCLGRIHQIEGVYRQIAPDHQKIAVGAQRRQTAGQGARRDAALSAGFQIVVDLRLDALGPVCKLSGAETGKNVLQIRTIGCHGVGRKSAHGGEVIQKRL